MSAGAGCLIIVPQDQPELYQRLSAQFSQHASIKVRLDARGGDRASSEVELFAVGGGDLDPALRAYVEEQIRLGGGS